MKSDDGAPEVTTVQARPVVVLVRYRPGVAGQAARTVHVVRHPGPVVSGAVSALCGALLIVEQIETVTPGESMPCTMCLLLCNSSAPRPLAAPPGESLPEIGVPSEPVAATDHYRAWGWPVTTHRDQVLLALDHHAVALLVPTVLATQVQPILAARQCPAPVLAHPDAPQHRVFLAGEPFGAPLPWPPGVQPVTGSLPLPPTVTPRGPVRWVHLPQSPTLTTCREIDLCSAACTALPPSSMPRPPTVSGQDGPS